MQKDDVEEVKEAITKMQECFYTLDSVLRKAPEELRRKFNNPSALGPVSAFLQQGKGYEPAFPGYEFNDCEKLVEELEAIVEPDEDESEDEDAST